jgi:hypothetical protein
MLCIIYLCYFDVMLDLCNGRGCLDYCFWMVGGINMNLVVC